MVKIMVMNDVSISEFKAKCLGLIEQVHKTRQPLRITRHGRPVAEVIPAGPDLAASLWAIWSELERLSATSFSRSRLDDIEAYRD